MTMTTPYYVTTPIYYVNDKPHIGHAYTTLACDMLARFKWLDGYDVMFLTGTDEHGQKVQEAADKAGVDPRAFTDSVSRNFRDLLGVMNFSNTQFIRTTEERHYASSQSLWSRLKERGHIRLDKYAGWYSVRDEAFFTETELVDGKAPTGAPVEWVEEPSYFFDLSQWQQPLLDFYKNNPDFIAPEGRKKEVVSFVSGGLKDLSVSRTTFNWGVPVPEDDAHVMYVWLDALTNYLTALNWHEDGGDFAKFWPADLHMVGKDILRFHAVYWPAFLMAADLPLPKRVFAHGWWTNEGEKISKSLGNVIDPLQLVNDYGLDQTRYFLMREVPFGRDGDFVREQMIQRINSDLANDIGNLAQRTLSLVYKNLDGQLPTFPAVLQPEDKELIEATDNLLTAVRAQMDKQAFHEALRLIWEVIAKANRYIDQAAPWALKKTNPARMAEVLAILVETLRQVTILIQPVMPESAGRLLDQLVIEEGEARQFSAIGGAVRLCSRQMPGKPEGVFPRYIEESGESA
jgi:methionyl-tRNA synthetase